MSTGTKIPHSEAMESAKRFRSIIIDSCIDHCCGGSLRRESPAVGDIEHVVISRTARYVPDGSMFEIEGPDVLRRLDELLEARMIEKQVKADGRTRWGEKYRACIFEGQVHEIFLAVPDNWGAILTIRTGPAEFSEAMVTRIAARGVLHMRGGFLVYQKGGDRYPCPDEETFFRAAGLEFVPPKLRGLVKNAR